MCQVIGNIKNELPHGFNSTSDMFLNPWYAGQPPAAGSAVAAGRLAVPGEDGQPPLLPPPSSSLTSASVDDESLHTTFTSDHGQDLVVEQANLSDEQLRHLSAIQQSLRPGWTVHLTTEGRFYYCNHYNQTSGWLPPSDAWNSTDRLPYGWESAIDPQGKTYFINHLNKTTTVEDPRRWDTSEQDHNNEPRVVELSRDAEHGFGFVAGSEKPVIVRFVRSGGPSVDRLMPGDLILKINGEDVRQAPRDHVIQLIRDCPETVTLEVCQPPVDSSSSRKSALLSAAKKSRLKNQPSRVRFAESVHIDGVSDHQGRAASSDSVVPLMPNVLKVFLENGQTKSFKYDTTTRVQDVINSLQAKLGLVSTFNFALVVEHVKSIRRNKFTILDPSEHLCRIASRPGVQNLRCLFRVTYFPPDAYDLLMQDPAAFDYLYLQCTNDVISERFSPELKNEVALRLASLHMYHHALSANGPNAKVTVKSVEKECGGLDRFIPPSLADSMKKKDVQKLLGHFLKLNSSLVGHGQKQLSGLQAQLHYLKLISELPSYGAKCFSTSVADSNLESVVLISPKFGISQINSLRNGVPIQLCEIQELDSLVVTREDQVTQRVFIHLKETDKDPIVLTLEHRDANELILVLAGYFRLLVHTELEVERDDEVRDENLIPYCSRHQVTYQGWNYPNGSDSDILHFVNFGAHPPYQSPPPGFQFMDSDDSSMWSSSTETTNVEEHSSLNEFQQNGKPGTELLPKKVVSRFEVTVLPQSQPKSKPPPPAPPVRNISQLQPQPHRHHDSEDEDDDDEDEPTANAEESDEEEDGIILPSTETLSSNVRVPEFSIGLAMLPLKKKVQLITPQGGDNSCSESECNDFSFGLHSPDKFNHETTPGSTSATAATTSAASSAILRDSTKPQRGESMRKKDRHTLIAEDADLIDLTALPPPMTPDEDKFLLPGINAGSSDTVETPPTPFADRLLEQELKRVLNMETSPLRQNADRNSYPMSDLESFIAKVTVPPPPDEHGRFNGIATTAQDLSGFIIPPPPPPRVNLSPISQSQSKTPLSPTASKPGLVSQASQSRAPAKLPTTTSTTSSKIDTSTSTTSTLVGGRSKVCFTDREIHEINVAKETFFKEPKEKISPRIASIQKMLANPGLCPEHAAAAAAAASTAAESAVSKNTSPPPPPPRHGVVLKPSSATNNNRSMHLPLTNVASKVVKRDEDPPSLPPRVVSVKVTSSSSTTLPQESPVDDVTRPTLPSKSQARSLPRPPAADTGPPKPPPPPPHGMGEKPQLPKKGPALERKEVLKSTPELSTQRSIESKANSTNGGIELNPLKPRAVSGSPLRINQKSSRQPETSQSGSSGGILRNNRNGGTSHMPSSSPNGRLNGFKTPISEMELESGVDSDGETFLTLDSRRQLFAQAEEVILRVVAAIEHSQHICATLQQEPVTERTAELYQRAKEQLTNDSRQFVTASKLFVKSATENERQLLECLGHCVQLIDRIGNVSREVALYTPTPQQTAALLVKVKDVAETYLLSVRAAGVAVGRELHDPSMDVLMKRATTLASVLTNLMRTLRVFM